MRKALRMSLALFRNYYKNSTFGQRALIMISDGEATDGNSGSTEGKSTDSESSVNESSDEDLDIGDPISLAATLKQEGVTMATIFLTDDDSVIPRMLYDQPPGGLNNYGPTTLFDMASKVAVIQHPVPVLGSMGWAVPSSGECALFAVVRSSDALDEFCSVLLSARFGSADALLDIVGKVNLDAYISDEHIRTRNNPSDQGQTSTCYAHAAAGVIHMALVRIVDREGGCPSIADIRDKILREYPPGPGGRGFVDVLTQAIQWYRPLRFRAVDEDGARQAVLHHRPVLATFHLSNQGWDAFSRYFSNTSNASNILQQAHMPSHDFHGSGGGHAVILVGCDPSSLTFLNSWGSQWGNKGSFSVAGHEVLENKGAPEWARMTFYDVYWVEGELTAQERKAYDTKIDALVRTRAEKHPSIFEFKVQCPLCRKSTPISDFTGNIRFAACPHCRQSFKPDPGHLVQALYAQAGLGDVV
jgi:hypothetical protein